MNRIYRTLWSIATQSWQAVPETAKSADKKSKSSASGVVASFALSWILTSTANAQAPPAINQLPTGGAVIRGTATINQTATAQAAAMTVNQTSQRAVVNWNTFNIGSAASVNFVQPNKQAITLNRVSDANPSQIFGRMTANGQVVLTNANGIYFAPGSSVDVGAITATTHSMTDDNFMSGKYVFERNSATGKVVNEGNITAALAGYVALLAPEVQNTGVVVARAGTVVMAAGETITLNIDGAGSLAGISTTPSAIATLIENKHAVQAPDGQIILSAVALNKLQAGVIKNSGSLEANSLVSKGGKIVLEADDITLTATSKLEAKGATGGGTVLVGGDWQGSGDLRQATKVTMEAGATIDASATDKGDGGKVVLWSDVHNANSLTTVAGTIHAEGKGEGTRGGQIETSGAQLHVADTASIRMGGAGVTGGKWLLDPTDFNIGGGSSDISGATLSGQITAGNTVEILNSSGASGTAGNININGNVSWNNSGVLKLTAFGGVTGSGNIDMGLTGGGSLIFNQSGASEYSGIISGNGSIIKDGSGELTLSGMNSYAGTTAINTGILKVGHSSAIGSNAMTVANGATLDLNGKNIGNGGGLTLNGHGVGNGGALINSSATAATYSQAITLGSDTKINAETGAITLSNNVSPITGAYALTIDGTAGGTIYSDIGTSTGTLTKQGTGTWILIGTNNYSGTTTISAGTLQIGDSTSTSTLGSGNVINNGTLKFKRTAAVALTVSNNISGTGNIEQAGSKIILTGDNTYSGTTTITGGFLTVGAGTTGTLGTGNVILNSNIYSLSFNRTDNIIVGNNISGIGGIENANTGTTTLTGNNTYTGLTRVSQGTLQVGNGGTSGNIGAAGQIINNSILKFNRSDALLVSNNFLSGPGSVIQAGLGTTTLSGSNNNTYTGGTTVSAGILKAGSSSAFSTGAITVAAGATLDLNGQSIGNTGGLILNGNGINNSGALINSSVTGATYSKRVTLGSDSTISGTTGTITLNWGTNPISGAYGLTLDGAAGGSISSVIGTSTGTLTKRGSGTWTLTATNTYSGNTTINAGTLQIGDGGTSGTLGTGLLYDNGTLFIKRSGALSLSNVASNTGAITGTGNIKIESTTGSLNIDRDISLSGANSRIDLLANSSATAGNSMSIDLTLSNTITTSSTGTINAFSGAPNTSALMLKMSGATGDLKYKTYSANASDLSNSVTGTRNLYYRSASDVSGNGAVTVSKTYDGTTATTSATFAGGTITGATDGDNFAAFITNGAYTSSNIGTNIVITGTPSVISASGSGWSLAGYTCSVCTFTFTGTITAKPLTITPTLNQSKYYGDADATLTYTTSGMVGNDSLSGTLARAAGESVGSYAYSIAGMSATNYALTLAAGADQFAINQRPITITPTALRKTYGNADPTFTASITSGSLASVTASDSLTDVIAGLTRTSGESAGSYDVVLTRGPKASSYLITFATNNQAFTIDSSTSTSTSTSKSSGSGTTTGVVTKPYVPALPILMATAGATSIPAQALSQLNTDQLSALRSNAAPAPLVQMSQRTTTPNEPVVIVPPQPTSESAPRTGVLPVTILQGTSVKPATSGVAFEQTEDALSLKLTTSPAVVAQAPKLASRDKLTSFAVSLPTGEVVVYEGGLVNNRLVIVATSTHAKRVARNDLKLVLSTAINSLGRDNRVMLDKLKSVLLDLR